MEDGESSLAAHLKIMLYSRIDRCMKQSGKAYLKHADKLTKMTIDLFEDKKDGGSFWPLRTEKNFDPPKVYDGAIPSEILLWHWILPSFQDNH